MSEWIIWAAVLWLCPLVLCVGRIYWVSRETDKAIDIAYEMARAAMYRREPFFLDFLQAADIEEAYRWESILNLRKWTWREFYPHLARAVSRAQEGCDVKIEVGP